MLMQNTTTGATYCAPVACNVTNCTTCYQNNTCSICETGYVVNNYGMCVTSTMPDCDINWCLSCNTNSTCGLCKFGYNLQQDGLCYPNYGVVQMYSGEDPGFEYNCQSGFTGYSCQFCKSGYMVSTSYSCVEVPGFVCNVNNCTTCSNATACALCEDGFYTNSVGECVEYECSIEYCSQCSDNLTCSACLPAY